jgi:hypothetical protein
MPVHVHELASARTRTPLLMPLGAPPAPPLTVCVQVGRLAHRQAAAAQRHDPRALEAQQQRRAAAALVRVQQAAAIRVDAAAPPVAQQAAGQEAQRGVLGLGAALGTP